MDQSDRRWVNASVWLVFLVGAILLLTAIVRLAVAFDWFGFGGDVLLNAQFIASILQGLGGLGTLVLAYLYLQQRNVMEEQADTQQLQAEIMDGQRDLRRMQLNRDVRQQHTEILRHRVEEWLGNSPATSREFGDMVDQQSTLPRVTRVGVESAAKMFSVFGDEEFLAAPSWLVDDQYFHDLLENHAPDLGDLKTEIEALEADFSEQHEQFLEGIGTLPRIATDEYVIEPAYNFEQWVFEQILLLERGDETHEELIDRASNVVSGSAMRSGDTTVFPAEAGYGTPVSVVQVRSNTGKYETVSENRDQIEEEIVSMLRSVLREIDEVEPYHSARQAGDILEELSGAVSELRFKLEEYQGLPLFPGECEYLEAELID